MKEQVFFLNMFPDYVPPEGLAETLSQAAIVAADIDPAAGRVEVVIHSARYIPSKCLITVSEEICKLYGLRSLSVCATHP